MDYYFVLSHRPSKSYTLSIVIASASSTILTFFILLQLIFGTKNPKARLPFESLLFHGLSYEEWRTAKVVKRQMEKVQIITEEEQELPEDLYLVLLLILSFSGVIEHRPMTPDEMSEALIGMLPHKDDVLKSYLVDPTGLRETTEVEHIVGDDEAETFASLRQTHINEVKDRYYQGKTLSRLVYDGVNLVFRRKKIGPKPPARTNTFLRAFGIATR